MLKNRHIRKMLVLVAIVVLFALVFWSSLSLQDWFLSAVDTVSYYIENNEILGGLAFIGLAALSAMLSPFSSAPLVPVAVVVWDNTITTILLLVGWVIGGACTYFVGRYAGNPIFKKYFAPKEKIQQYKKRITKKSAFALVLLFRLAMPAEIPGYVLGAIRYNFLKYMIATFLAELPFAILTVYASDALLERDLVLFVVVGSIGLLILIISFYYFHKKLTGASKKH